VSQTKGNEQGNLQPVLILGPFKMIAHTQRQRLSRHCLKYLAFYWHCWRLLILFTL